MSDPRRELAALAASLRSHLEDDVARGATWIEAPAHPRALSAAPADSTPPGRSTAAAPSPAASAGAEESTRDRGKKLSKIPIAPKAADYDTRMEALHALGQEAAACTKCGLCKTRTQVVYGSGTARMPVMFIGEAPGAEEDRKGLPFVGRAGKLLDQIIDAVGFDRKEVYVANILKCRPPNNRDPKPEEIEQCTPYLERQIELVKPKLICALGRFAGQFLTDKPKATMGALRGKIHHYRDIMVLPIYHPAALLRNPAHKRVVWEDVQILRREYLR